MSASLVYLLLRQVLQMLSQLAWDGGAKDVEILVLRRQVHRPDLEPCGCRKLSHHHSPATSLTINSRVRC
ncbi:hypothetical protein [Micromonospora sp. NPDC005087]|uniref:hypothetical protein n=1 Tax=Micromonospora sp. NPDC005087 TaxID=3364225 RepID=UPI0036C54B3E